MKKLLAIAAALAVFGACLAGCAAPAQTEGYSDNGAVYGAEAPAEKAAVEEEVAAEDTAAQAAGGIEETGGAQSVVIPDDENRKLVYTADYSLETAAFDKDYAALYQAIAAAGGYVGSESTSGTKPESINDAGRTSYITARIPVGKYEAFLSAIEGIGTVISKNQNTEDISTSYYDTESRIELLEDHYKRLQEHLAKTTKMSDVIELEKEMRDVLGELDGLRGSRRHMDDMVAMCTVNVSMTEVVKTENVTDGGEKESVADRAGENFAASMEGVGIFFQEFFVGFMGVLPALIVIIVIAGIVLAIIMLVRKRKKPQKQTKKPEPPKENGEGAKENIDYKR